MQEPPIRTPDQRLRVFVSSTLAELAEERGAVHEAIERLQLAPVMFELGARPHPPRNLYRAYLEQSQVFVGIYWQRYGWVAPGETVSGLEDEYLLSSGMPRLLYVKAPAEKREPRLGQLLRRIQDDDTASYKSFRTPDELARLVAADLAVLLSERFTSMRPPAGVVTFLFVDIRGRDAEPTESASGESAQALTEQTKVLRRVIKSRGGYLFSASDQTVRAAFDHPVEALTAVAELPSVLKEVSPADGGSTMFRAALHCGVADARQGMQGDGYVGPTVLRTDRLLATAHVGQVLVSAAVVDLLGNALPPPLSLRSLGPHRLYEQGRVEEIHQLLLPGLPTDFPPLQTIEGPRDNLPIPLTSFVGRERELSDLQQTLQGSRLVTLTGVGGAGKSRLAIAAASELRDAFPDGVCMVQLAPLRESDQIASAIAAALQVPEDPHRPLLETLTAQLQAKQTLMVIDNCEHLLASCAELIATLLQSSARLRVLATSREALAVPGEVIMPVPPLALPAEATDLAVLAEFSSVRLFVDRARAVRPSFSITPANTAAVIEIVTRLDGIPLALELAAARVKLLSAGQIADRLSDRFRLLSGGGRTVLPRQQTLQGAIDWSYDLLEEHERTLLRRLAVFAGSWTVEAAMAVCSDARVEAGDVLDLLGRLVDKSLVVVIEGVEENRFGLLETIRQYGRERLFEADETNVIEAAHRDWCRSLVETAATQLRGGAEQVRWLKLLEADRANISAAMESASTGGDTTTSLRIAIGAAWFWYLRGHWDEAGRCLGQSLAVEGADPVLRAEGEAWAALFLWRRQETDAAKEQAQSSLSTLDGSGTEGEGLCLLVLTLVAISERELDAADAYGQRALQVFRRQDHRWGVTTALLVLTHIAMNRKSPAFTSLLEESAALLESGPDRWGRAHVLNLRGYQALNNLDLERAQDLYTASHELAVELGDRAGQAENLLALGHVHLLRGKNEEATQALQENRSLLEQLQDHHQLAHVDQALALLAISGGREAEGDALFQDVTRRLGEMGLTMMGGTYALGTADLYRRAGRPNLARALLRHAMTLINPTIQPAEYARAQQQVAALADVGEEQHDRTSGSSLNGR
jgi:predicted ATPase/class 3 adenylate cyclase